MIEGRSGGSGRGTRRESCALPDSGSAQPTDRRFVSCTRLSTRSRSLRRPRISFPPPLPHPRTCLLATGKNSAAPERTFSSALVSPGWRAQRENDRRNQFIRQRLSSVSVHNAAGGERTRRSVPSIHFLDIDLTPCSRSHLLIAAESNRTQEPTRNDGINPRFARRKIVMRDI